MCRFWTESFKLFLLQNFIFIFLTRSIVYDFLKIFKKTCSTFKVSQCSSLRKASINFYFQPINLSIIIHHFANELIFLHDETTFLCVFRSWSECKHKFQLQKNSLELRVSCSVRESIIIDWWNSSSVSIQRSIAMWWFMIAGI